MHSFDYIKPKTIESVVRLLASNAKVGCVLAGGTQLLAEAERRGSQITLLVDVKGVSAMRLIDGSGTTGLYLGAAVTVREMVENALVQRHYPMLWDICNVAGPPRIKNRATVGGNVCAVNRKMDIATAMLCYDARCSIVGPSGKRDIALNDYFLDGQGLAEGEVLVSLHLPVPPPNSLAVYNRFPDEVRLNPHSVAAVGVLASQSESGLTDWRLSYVSGGLPQRLSELERSLPKSLADEAAVKAVVQSLVTESHVAADSAHVSQAYRLSMLKMLIEQGIHQVIAQSQGIN